ncbi:MAG: phosphate ABC transporter permease subunit PstC [Fervidicoccaceae archaeon]
MRRNLTDKIFFFSLLFPSALVLFTLILIFYSQLNLSLPIFEKQGLETFLGKDWRPSSIPPPEGGKYGLLPAVFGSLYTSTIALLVSLPLSASVIVFLNEIAPKKARTLFSAILDLMAGLPSVIYGIWGLYFLGPLLKNYIMEPLNTMLSFLPFFSCPPLSSTNVFTAGILLGIMITPFQATLLDETYKSIPNKYVLAMHAMGLTLFERSRMKLSMIRGAIVSSILLGFGRASGETAAVTLVVGNVYALSLCVFSPAYTISSLIVNQFPESQSFPYMINALFAGSLFLLLIGLAINTLGVRMLKKVRF